MENEKYLEREPEVIDGPHFDQAWTILCARPVVPLKKVESSQGVRGALKLVAAFVGASLLGVVVALASIRLREMSASVTEIEVPAGSESTPSSSGDSIATEQTSIAPEVEAATVATKTPSHVGTEASKHQSIKPSTSLGEIRSEVIDPGAVQPQLADEWQERRPRRTAVRRHRRDVDDLHHRDLMRIQEIFEGRRPRNP
jgi:hypothetical protein